MLGTTQNDLTLRLLEARSSNVTDHPHRIYKRITNERMGGTVPVWEDVKTSAQQIQQNLSQAEYKDNPSFEATLAYTNAQKEGPSMHEAEFGFGDMIDIVNPLQHLPIISYLYREVTGDEINPVGQIIGGGIYGGVAGAAGGLINAVIKGETGNDLGGHALTYAKSRFDDEAPFDTNANPEQRLNTADKNLKTGGARADDLPASLLGFTDQSIPSGFKIERIAAASAQTREPITEVRISGLYALAKS